MGCNWDNPPGKARNGTGPYSSCEKLKGQLCRGRGSEYLESFTEKRA